MEVKLVLYEVLKRYRVTSVDPENKLNLMSELVLSNKEGIRITIEERKSWKLSVLDLRCSGLKKPSNNEMALEQLQNLCFWKFFWL